MRKNIKIPLLLFYPALLLGIEFFSSELGHDGTGWFGSSLYDSIPHIQISLSAFRGYEGTDIREGVIELISGKKNQGYGFIIQFQGHELLSSQAMTFFYRRYVSDMLRGSVEIHGIRAGITGMRADNELSVSWELLMMPASWMNTVIAYHHKPARSFPEKVISLTCPSWSGSLRFLIKDEAFLQGGVMCRDGFAPEWAAGFGFKGGMYTDITMTRFSLTRALNASFGIHYRDWKFQWIFRWHPYLGLSGGSALVWAF